MIITPAVSFRVMTTGDLAGADELRRLAGWNQTMEDWREMLRLGGAGCFVAEGKGKVLGTVMGIMFGQALAWIGMMLVHPDHRRHGIGAGLMQRVLKHLQQAKVGCIKLDATPAGYPLYEKLGFVTERKLTRWQRPENVIAPAETASCETRELQEADWPAVERLDTAGIGARRGAVLRSLAQRSRSALVWPAHGKVAGWALLRGGARSDYLGPLQCTDSDGGLGLAAALLRFAEGRSVFWDIPDENEHAKAVAQKLGFEKVRPLTRMWLGAELTPAQPRVVFGIADPAVG